MKILLSAFSCLPCKTSEPGNAWRIVNHLLRENHEVWALIEETGYQEGMMKFLAEHPMPGFHPLFFQLPQGLTKLLWQPEGMRSAVYYHLWQQKLLRVAKDLHQRVDFDLSHHVTFRRYWSPSGWRVLNIPFIWGPVGAAETPPRSSLTKTRPNPCLGRSS